MSDFSGIPYLPHYAIITRNVQTIDHEGDERSRTHPGHGYPAYSETVEIIKYYHFNSRSDWEQEIKTMVLSKKEFRAFEVKPVKVEVGVSVKINDLK